ncbi:glycoside hydrolase family 16 protein [Calocera viscosa TUFC12733]|uniref:Glycoside hydrolase family 16 protein n=1 Tax=Calocera viscosa (strain TUFC12733) TaxID=1330018 RepID=A0A167FMN1_CALVF|nr:glycoside hydrolase family 16 protein [Calocera viscosa TUFC12733]
MARKPAAAYPFSSSPGSSSARPPQPNTNLNALRIPVTPERRPGAPSPSSATTTSAASSASRNPFLTPSPGTASASPSPAQAGRSTATNRPYGTASAANSSTHLMPPSAASSTASLVSSSGSSLRPQPTSGNTPRAALSAPPLNTSSKSATTAPPSISDKFSLSPDPSLWGGNLSLSDREADDYLHNPDPKRDRKNDRGGTMFTARGIVNLGCLFIMAAGLIALFAGYPIISFFTTTHQSTQGGYNLGGINQTGQVPEITGALGLIDVQTPAASKSHTGWMDQSTYDLVFSDEFNVEGRSFYPGDDPYWEAVNLHYWETNNLEWYDPSAITTTGGNLKIWLNKTENHDLNYMGGMMSTWNKFCFTGGYIEVSVSLPGDPTVWGLWPAIWTMGNLGRAGYGASLDGMWPYTYESCDVGTLANQTQNGGPPDALTTGDPDWNGALSFLPGQRLSACTCAGEDHPGPQDSSGNFVGRAAPEIDILEAQVYQSTRTGAVSQSVQMAPFNAYWQYTNTSNADFQIYNAEITEANGYLGGVYQQAASSVSITNQNCYSGHQSGETGCFAVYGFEYEPGDSGYITWINNGQPAWTVYAPALGPDANTGIAQRPIPTEPMYILANLGISENFGAIDYAELVFPVYLLIDYVRVYQKQGSTNIGCDPADHPTAQYIQNHIDAYSNWNLTTFDDFAAVSGSTWPKNKLIDTC